MKTTVDIGDRLLEEAKAVAAREKTTLRALLEDGLRWVISRKKKPAAFRLRDASVPGKGIQSGVTEGRWEEIREAIYRGRGA